MPCALRPTFDAVMQTRLLTRPEEAAALLRQGNLVALPTETVYGLAGNAFSAEAVAGIFAAKQRPAFDPLIVHLAGAVDLPTVARHVPPAARALADRFWPGPLTLVLPRTERVPDLVTSGLDTVATRVPDHPMTREVLGLLKTPLAAPSANPFGYVSPTTAEHVIAQLGGRIAAVLDGGPCQIGLESTIVGFPGGKPTIYRLGGLSPEDLESVVGPLGQSLQHSSDPRAPGQLKSHYAPRVPVYFGDPSAAAERFAGKKLGLLSFRDVYPGSWSAVRRLSPEGDMAEAARNLFRFLRELDAAPLDMVVAEPLPGFGLGRAINDRLQRAAHRQEQ